MSNCLYFAGYPIDLTKPIKFRMKISNRGAVYFSPPPSPVWTKAKAASTDNCTQEFCVFQDDMKQDMEILASQAGFRKTIELGILPSH